MKIYFIAYFREEWSRRKPIIMFKLFKGKAKIELNIITFANQLKDWEKGS